MAKKSEASKEDERLKARKDRVDKTLEKLQQAQGQAKKNNGIRGVIPKTLQSDERLKARQDRVDKITAEKFQDAEKQMQEEEERVLSVLGALKNEALDLPIGDKDKDYIEKSLAKITQHAKNHQYNEVDSSLKELSQWANKRQSELENPTVKASFKKFGQLIKAAIEVCIETISMGKITKGAKKNYQSLTAQREFEKAKTTAAKQMVTVKDAITTAHSALSRPPHTPVNKKPKPPHQL